MDIFFFFFIAIKIESTDKMFILWLNFVTFKNFTFS